MTWCTRCGYDYGSISHGCGGSGYFPQPTTSISNITPITQDQETYWRTRLEPEIREKLAKEIEETPFDDFYNCGDSRCLFRHREKVIAIVRGQG